MVVASNSASPVCMAACMVSACGTHPFPSSLAAAAAARAPAPELRRQHHAAAASGPATGARALPRRRLDRFFGRRCAAAAEVGRRQRAAGDARDGALAAAAPCWRCCCCCCCSYRASVCVCCQKFAHMGLGMRGCCEMAGSIMLLLLAHAPARRRARHCGIRSPQRRQRCSPGWFSIRERIVQPLRLLCLLLLRVLRLLRRRLMLRRARRRSGRRAAVAAAFAVAAVVAQQVHRSAKGLAPCSYTLSPYAYAAGASEDGALRRARRRRRFSTLSTQRTATKAASTVVAQNQASYCLLEL